VVVTVAFPVTDSSRSAEDGLMDGGAEPV